ncbi:MAG: beta-ketoacyl reductase, partial [Gemmatimonadaceae bacterium]
EALRASGARVDIVQLDIADATQVKQLCTRLSSLPVLRGVIHAAGVLDDAILSAQNPARVRAVAAPKMMGAANLEAMLPLEGVDFFVSYSSVASALGTTGQANYAAANAFLDAQAHSLRARGIPATSISFGPFSDVGMATQGRGLQRLRERGLRGLRIAHADAALDALAGSDVTHVIVANWNPLEWTRVHCEPAELRRLSAVLPLSRPGRAEETHQASDLRERVAKLPGERQRRDALRDFVRHEVSKVLRTSIEHVDATRALKQLGVDSLTAIELRNRLERATQLRLSATLIFSYPTVNAIADHLGSQLAVDSERDTEVDALAAALSGLSDDELTRLLGRPDAEPVS